MIDWVVARAEQIGYPVLLAIPKGDSELARVCLHRGWTYTEGSEEDVLDRYVDAARTVDCDHVIRVTADCPFLDVEAAQFTVQHHLAVGADITTYHLAEGRGVQVIRTDALERAFRKAAPDQRHSPDIWLLEHGRVEWMKFSVDTEEDLALARKRAEGDT